MVEYPPGYTETDTERMHPEKHSTHRSDFARDRARVLHSSALRRLGAKTQVLSPETDVDIVRNRLTHSLEVAQVGRELGARLGLDPDVVDTACLAHDLGHPPYGHNGERALNDWAKDIGGFEGNAQSLRLLTRIEPKVFDRQGNAYGLNLTRASLDASCKYPWSANEAVPDASGRRKFGYYPEDSPVFVWLREGVSGRARCVEAQVMDLADDIAYSVHDFEDAIITGHLNPASIISPAEQDSLIHSAAEWIGGALSHDTLLAACYRLTKLPYWITTWDASRTDQARLKNLTSQLIGRFAGEAVRATRAAHPGRVLSRFGAAVVVPTETGAEIAVLKGVVAAYVMSADRRQAFYARQREVLRELAEMLWHNPTSLESGFAADFAGAANDAERKRVIVDQVASLTDPAAGAWHRNLN